MRTKPDFYYRQSAVIPYRVGDGRCEILLITSRKRKRWVLPKRIWEPGLSAAESASKEAWEEAGVRGRVSAARVGRFQYRKWGGTCTVDVFTMEVESVLAAWPEDFRDRAWLAPDEAARRVDEPDLERLLLAVGELA